VNVIRVLICTYDCIGASWCYVLLVDNNKIIIIIIIKKIIIIALFALNSAAIHK
jgi:hypothetical protein